MNSIRWKGVKKELKQTIYKVHGMPFKIFIEQNDSAKNANTSSYYFLLVFGIDISTVCDRIRVCVCANIMSSGN